MKIGLFDHVEYGDRPLATLFDERLEFVAAAEEAGFYKPDPRPYRLALEKLGIEAQGLIPGFANAHGTLEANETKGTLTLTADRIATSLGRAPSEFWPDFYDDVDLTDLDTDHLFHPRPHRKAHPHGDEHQRVPSTG